MPRVDGRMHRIAMPDGTQWLIPLDVIALRHAAFYAKNYNENTARSYQEGTLPLLVKNPAGIMMWARKHLAWEDIKEKAVLAQDSEDNFYERGWTEGNNES